MKRRRLWGSMILDVGGEYRLRQENRHILTLNDNCLLQRTRIYADLHIDDWFPLRRSHRLHQRWEDLPPSLTNENRFDALNLLATRSSRRPWRLWLRGGRQELLYGAQR